MEETNIFATKAFWYFIHTHSSYELRVEKTIREIMRTGQDAGAIEDVIVPTECVVELVNGVKKVSTRKFYPGYVMVKMRMTDDSWYLIQSLSRVIAFMGGKEKPVPMKDSEAERILSAMENCQDQPRPKFNFKRLDEVRVLEGPFAGFNGVVEEVNLDKGKLKVFVSIFGRQTPVELDFIQVTKS
ncbi:MAG: transcription termination/antitermination protein NusG [Desulfovibrionaceae bacterium]